MNPTVSKNLKKLREAAHYTQDEVSKVLHITRLAYSHYESGERKIPINDLERISDLFGCEMAVFYENDINTESLILTSAISLECLTEADTEEIIHFNRIVKSYLKMQRLDEFSHHQKMSEFSTLYRCGDEGMVIGDYVEKARKLFEAGKISEGHYYELMNVIGKGEADIQDSAGC